jgi:hypothetical protein
VKLALEDVHLVPEHHDLDVLIGLGTTVGPEEAKDTAQAGVEQGESHGG